MDSSAIFGRRWPSFSPLAESKSCAIRLFELRPGIGQELIRGSLLTVDLNDAPDYEALSYRWQSPWSEHSLAWIDDSICDIQSNLCHALEALRHSLERRILWIDYICINQADLTERSRQVQLMGRIYHGASRVRVWLGNSEQRTDEVFESIRKASPATDLKSVLKFTFREELEFARFLTRSYWYRAWIIQEITLAQDLVFHCGSESLNEADFVRFCRWVWEAVFSMGGRRNESADAAANETPDYLIFPSWALLTQTRTKFAYSPSDQRSKLEMPHLRIPKGDLQTLEDLLILYRSAECAEPRDKIYSLLSLAADCRDGRWPRVDYSIPTQHLLTQVLRHCRPKRPLDLALSLEFPCDEDVGLDPEVAGELWSQPVHLESRTNCWLMGHCPHTISFPANVFEQLAQSSAKSVQMWVTVMAVNTAVEYFMRVFEMENGRRDILYVELDTASIVRMCKELYYPPSPGPED